MTSKEMEEWLLKKGAFPVSKKIKKRAMVYRGE